MPVTTTKTAKHNGHADKRAINKKTLSPANQTPNVLAVGSSFLSQVLKPFTTPSSQQRYRGRLGWLVYRRCLGLMRMRSGALAIPPRGLCLRLAPSLYKGM